MWRSQFALCCLYILILSCQDQVKRNTDTLAELNAARFGFCVPEIIDKSWYSSGKKAPLFSGLEGIHFQISTTNAEAQKYFNQGLMLSFGFNHAEAARSFFEAARLDSSCAICWWGFAYVLGPNYNGGMEKDNIQRAFDAVQKAKALSASCTQKEKDLIEALSSRYSNDTSIARSILDSSYATAMRKVYFNYPDDVHLATLFAESLMDLHPWNLFNKDGSIQPWTPEILKILENALQMDPNHAGANHFYIHATEMSADAHKALHSANLLLHLVPGSGHLVHMPSHTYIRTGKYHEGVLSNQKAVLVDSLYTVSCHAQGVYPLAYYPHNFHFLSACATLSGESKLAIESALATSNHAHKKLLRNPAWATLQHYYSIPWFVQVKLGLWKEIINSSKPEADLKYPSVIYHYAQGMAMLSTNKIKEARNHLTLIDSIMADTTLKDLSIWEINSIYDICAIASKTLNGEIHAKENKHMEAIRLLQEAITVEDALNYNEPPDWFFSIRHHLGAVLIDAGQWKEVQKIYQEDLKIFPDNGWALRGLMNVYEKMGNKSMHSKMKQQFEAAWQHADIIINSSRIL